MKIASVLEQYESSIRKAVECYAYENYNIEPLFEIMPAKWHGEVFLVADIEKELHWDLRDDLKDKGAYEMILKKYDKFVILPDAFSLRDIPLDYVRNEYDQDRRNVVAINGWVFELALEKDKYFMYNHNHRAYTFYSTTDTPLANEIFEAHTRQGHWEQDPDDPQGGDIWVSGPGPTFESLMLYEHCHMYDNVIPSQIISNYENQDRFHWNINKNNRIVPDNTQELCVHINVQSPHMIFDYENEVSPKFHPEIKGLKSFSPDTWIMEPIFSDDSNTIYIHNTNLLYSNTSLIIYKDGSYVVDNTYLRDTGKVVTKIDKHTISLRRDPEIAKIVVFLRPYEQDPFYKKVDSLYYKAMLENDRAFLAMRPYKKHTNDLYNAIKDDMTLEDMIEYGYTYDRDVLKVIQSIFPMHYMLEPTQYGFCEKAARLSKRYHVVTYVPTNEYDTWVDYPNRQFIDPTREGHWETSRNFPNIPNHDTNVRNVWIYDDYITFGQDEYISDTEIKFLTCKLIVTFQNKLRLYPAIFINGELLVSDYNIFHTGLDINVAIIDTVELIKKWIDPFFNLNDIDNRNNLKNLKWITDNLLPFMHRVEVVFTQYHPLSYTNEKGLELITEIDDPDWFPTYDALDRGINWDVISERDRGRDGILTISTGYPGIVDIIGLPGVGGEAPVFDESYAGIHYADPSYTPNPTPIDDSRPGRWAQSVDYPGLPDYLFEPRDFWIYTDFQAQDNRNVFIYSPPKIKEVSYPYERDYYTVQPGRIFRAPYYRNTLIWDQYGKPGTNKSQYYGEQFVNGKLNADTFIFNSNGEVASPYLYRRLDGIQLFDFETQDNDFVVATTTNQRDIYRPNYTLEDGTYSIFQNEYDTALLINRTYETLRGINRINLQDDKFIQIYKDSDYSAITPITHPTNLHDHTTIFFDKYGYLVNYRIDILAYKYINLQNGHTYPSTPELEDGCILHVYPMRIQNWLYKIDLEIDESRIDPIFNKGSFNEIVIEDPMIKPLFIPSRAYDELPTPITPKGLMQLLGEKILTRYYLSCKGRIYPPSVARFASEVTPLAGMFVTTTGLLGSVPAVNIPFIEDNNTRDDIREPFNRRFASETIFHRVLYSQFIENGINKGYILDDIRVDSNVTDYRIRMDNDRTAFYIGTDNTLVYRPNIEIYTNDIF